MFSPDVFSRVREALLYAESTHQVRVLFACESKNF